MGLYTLTLIFQGEAFVYKDDDLACRSRKRGARDLMVYWIIGKSMRHHAVAAA